MLVNRAHQHTPSVSLLEFAPFNQLHPLCWLEIWTWLNPSLDDRQVLHRIADVLLGDQRNGAICQAALLGKLRERIGLISHLALPRFSRELVLVRFKMVAW